MNLNKQVKISGFLEKVKLTIQMVIDKKNGVYNGISSSSMALLMGLGLYIVCPVDFVTDLLLPFGLVDDAIITAFVLNLIEKELIKYRQFRVEIIKQGGIYNG